MSIEFKSGIDISIIFLTLNEVKNIEPLIIKTIELLKKIKKSFEIIVSDGGSIDGTLELLKKISMKFKEVNVIVSSKSGYGIQLMNGFSDSNGKIVIYMDGDGQYEVDDILKFISIDENIIASAKKEENSNLILRRIISKMFSKIINRIMGIDIPDFTSGFKKIPGELARSMKLNWGYYFLASTELIITAKKSGYDIVTIPVRCKKRLNGKSKLVSLMGLKAILKDCFYLLKIIIKK